MIRALVLCCLMMALPASAQQVARDAAIRLQSAASGLERAQGAEARISALTEVVAAYDAGLSALRDGLRQVAQRQGALQADLTRREDRISRLIGVLAGIEGTPRPLLLMHPEGPAGTARAAMLLGEAAPALEGEAAQLRADLQQLADLRALEEEAAASLEAGLNQVQSAREALSVAISDRTDLPARVAAGGDALDALREQAVLLASFAESLTDLPGPPTVESTGPLPLPVRGTVLRGYGAQDAAGIARPGIILAASPQAPVLAPTRATVRHVGPLLDYGLVIILEARAGLLIVLAGAELAYVERGDIVAPGTTLGLMGDIARPETQNDAETPAGGGAFATDTLYVEVREGGTPVDPGNWFDLTRAEPSTDE